MPKILMLATVLLLPAFWLPAQQGESGQTAGKSSNLTTIEGCLSILSGQYFVTDGSGTKHELSGYGNKLKAYIGHQVQIAGKPAVKTVESTTYGAASSAEEVPVFDVKSVKDIANTCKAK